VELSDFFSAFRRRWLLAVVTFLVVVLVGLAGTRLSEASYSASAELLVVPAGNATNVQVLQYLVSALPAQVEGQTFHDEVAASLPVALRTAAVKISSSSDQVSGRLSISAQSDDQAVVVAWADAAASLIGSVGAKAVPNVGSIVLLDRADTAVPSSSSKKIIVVGSVGLAIILAPLVTALAEAYRGRVGMAERVRQEFGLPVLGQIPGRTHLRGLEPLVVFRGRDRSAGVAMAFEAMAFALSTYFAGRTRRSLAVVSALGAEGRSTVAANLGWALAGIGVSAVVVDADFRSPGQEDLFASSAALGDRGGAAGETIGQATGCVGLRLIPAVAGEGTPASAVFKELPDLLSRVERLRRLAVVDGPALNSAPEAFFVAGAVEATVVVVDVRRNGMADIGRTIARLDAAGVTLAGVVLNRVGSRTHWPRRPLRTPRPYRVPRSKRTLPEPTPNRPDRTDEGAARPELAVDLREVGATPEELLDRGSTGGLPRRLGKNLIGIYGAVVLAGISALVVTPLVIHYLGKEEYGAYSLITVAAGYLILFNGGFGTATVKLVADDAGRRPDRIIRTFNTSFAALSIMAAVALVLGLVFGYFSPEVFNIPTSLHNQSIIAFEILAVAFVLCIPATATIGVVMGFQRYELQGIVDSAGIVVLAAGTILAASMGWGIVGIAVATALATGVANGSPWFIARRLVPGLRLSPHLIDRSRLRDTTVLSSWYLAQELATTLNDEADLVVVGLLLNLRDVALFAVGAQMAQLVQKGISPFQQVFFPHVASISSESGRDGLAEILCDGTRTVLAVALPMSAVLLFLAHPAIHLWVGGGYGTAAEVTMVLVAAGLLRGVSTVGAQILVGLGQARTGSIIAALTAVVNLAVSVALAGSLGAVGVALGTLIAFVTVYVPATVVIAVRLSGLSMRHWLGRAILPHLLPLAITVGILSALAPMAGAQPAPLAGLAGGSCLLYWTLYGLFSATPTERLHFRRVAGRVMPFIAR
jgi:O-antigen/teichoic acid export membrane protein/Mrp family chromosome partitioning ATPase